MARQQSVQRDRFQNDRELWLTFDPRALTPELRFKHAMSEVAEKTREEPATGEEPGTGGEGQVEARTKVDGETDKSGVREVVETGQREEGCEEREEVRQDNEEQRIQEAREVEEEEI